MLQKLELPAGWDEATTDPATAAWIEAMLERIRTFQDRWDRPQIEQFVTADLPLVHLAILAVVRGVPRTGDRFLEWGCGFGAISAMAAAAGLDADGAEVEPDLLAGAEATLADRPPPVAAKQGRLRIVKANFLPPGAEALADDPYSPSLHHDGPTLQDSIGCGIDDYDIVYSYPWPGEEYFHLELFEAHAADGALLLQFRGPADVRLWRNVVRRGRRRSSR